MRISKLRQSSRFGEARRAASIDNWRINSVSRAALPLHWSQPGIANHSPIVIWTAKTSLAVCSSSSDADESAGMMKWSEITVKLCVDAVSHFLHTMREDPAWSRRGPQTSIKRSSVTDGSFDPREERWLWGYLHATVAWWHDDDMRENVTVKEKVKKMMMWIPMMITRRRGASKRVIS